MYYYADGRDKNGNRLITSYGKQAQAAKYRVGARITEGEKFLNIAEDGSATLGSEGTLLVRTLMLKPEGAAEEVMSGRFVVYARINGAWQETHYRYKSYSDANSAVKGALINLFDGCAIIEEPEGATRKSAPQEEVDEESPF